MTYILGFALAVVMILMFGAWEDYQNKLKKLGIGKKKRRTGAFDAPMALDAPILPPETPKWGVSQNPLDLQFWPLEKSIYASAVWKFDGCDKPTVEFQITNLCPGEIRLRVIQTILQRVDAYGVHPFYVAVVSQDLTLHGVLETATLCSFLYAESLPVQLQIWAEVEVERSDGATVKGRVTGAAFVPSADSPNHCSG
jgi:hypothetical protein